MNIMLLLKQIEIKINCVFSLFFFGKLFFIVSVIPMLMVLKWKGAPHCAVGNRNHDARKFSIAETMQAFD